LWGLVNEESKKGVERDTKIKRSNALEVTKINQLKLTGLSKRFQARQKPFLIFQLLRREGYAQGRQALILIREVKGQRSTERFGCWKPWGQLGQDSLSTRLGGGYRG